MLACVVQGNIRSNFEHVLRSLIPKFDYIIISTWENDHIEFDCPENVIIVKNRIPKIAGYSNRNLQRFTTANGLRIARELNCDYILKWRTDMLPINLDLKFLFNQSQFDIPQGFNSRIVTCAFRNLSVNPDWFSSIPDYFSFGHIDIMEVLWGDNEFDYSQMYNLPEEMKLELGVQWTANKDIAGYYCAESELYAIFKQRIQQINKDIYSHEEILKSFFNLIDHKSLAIIWFGANGLFRPILALNFPWWTPSVWNGTEKAKLIAAGYPQSIFWKYFSKYIVYFITRLETYKQKKLLKKFLASKK